MEWLTNAHLESEGQEQERDYGQSATQVITQQDDVFILSTNMRPTTTTSVVDTVDKDVDNTLARLRSDLEDLREKRKAARVTQGAVEADLRNKLSKMHNTWQSSLLHHEDKNRNGKHHQLSLYVQALGDAQRLVPRRVLVQQASLCQTLHRLEWLERQRVQVVAENQRMVGFTQTQIQTIRDAKSRLETDMADQCFQAATALKGLQKDLNERLLEAGATLNQCSWRVLPDQQDQKRPFGGRGVLHVVDLNGNAGLDDPYGSDESKQHEHDEILVESQKQYGGHVGGEEEEEEEENLLTIPVMPLHYEGLQTALRRCEDSLRSARKLFPVELPPDMVPRKPFDRESSMNRAASYPVV